VQPSAARPSSCQRPPREGRRAHWSLVISGEPKKILWPTDAPRSGILASFGNLALPPGGLPVNKQVYYTDFRIRPR
jgi:hypothetical protein